MSSAERRVIYIMNELAKHIDIYYRNKVRYTGPDFNQQELNWSARKWAAKEFYRNIVERAPRTPTDLYLDAEAFIRFMNDNSTVDYMFSIAYDVAIELYDFVISVV